MKESDHYYDPDDPSPFADRFEKPLKDWQIDALAARLGIDQQEFGEIVHRAAHLYGIAVYRRQCGYDDPDDLDRIEESAAHLIRLLDNHVNLHRLIGDEDCGDAISRRLNEGLAFLNDLRDSSGRVHFAPKRGRPSSKDGRGRLSNNADIRVAYNFLSKWYIDRFGKEKFTNNWHGDDPTSTAAHFLYEVFCLIDPALIKLKLAAMLSELIKETVKNIPGERQGRKLPTGGK